ncbi:MAG: P-loop NTPase [Bacteroidetes bacterium]|nr:P-loop NTPase [Bacteroidota bacterium]
MKIAIASGKGGTGKTTLSTNLAVYLSQKYKVVLIDMDVEEPNSGLFIKAELFKEENQFKMIPEWIKDECTLCGICQEVCNYNAIIQLGTIIMVFPELCHGCYACSELCPTSSLPMIPKKMGKLRHYENNKLSFVESRLDIGQEQATQLINQTNKYVDEYFPGEIIKIYDAPPGTSCPVMEATKDADYVILVTEPTPFGLHDLKLTVETMKELKKNYGVVINRYGIGNNEVQNYCREENIPVLAKIPNDRQIAELYSSGKLIYQKVPEVEQQLENIENYILKLGNVN